jgi:hypothetical protein
MKTPTPHRNIKLSNGKTLFSVMAVLMILFCISYVSAAPAGAEVTSNSTSAASSTTPSNRSDAGGTINTMTLSVTQQDSNWKAYVGNVTGLLTLDDVSGYTIYQWSLGSADVTGEVYVSRSANVGWSTLNCSNISNLVAEQSTIGFTAASADDINKTFNETTHAPIVVAGRTIAGNSCRSTATYVNDTKQSIVAADFQEVLLASDSDVVYMSALNQGSLSYSNNMRVDFQLIVPDDVTTAATRYYFYIEIGT